MPDPNGPFYRHTKEYHDRLIERELYKLYQSDYPDVKWVQGVMERLERKAPHGDYTEQDRLDFKKAREIVARVTAKHIILKVPCRMALMTPGAHISMPLLKKKANKAGSQSHRGKV